MPYAIRSYKGQDDWGSDTWLAHMNLGSGLFMSFFGRTQEEAEAKARNWYELEQAKYDRLEGRTQAVKADSNNGWTKTNPVDNGWGKPANEVKPIGEIVKELDGWDKGTNGWGNASISHLKDSSAGGGSEHGMAGKVWMINKDNHRIRVAPNEIYAYEDAGYVRGGPRSVWKD